MAMVHSGVDPRRIEDKDILSATNQNQGSVRGIEEFPAEKERNPYIYYRETPWGNGDRGEGMEFSCLVHVPSSKQEPNRQDPLLPEPSVT